MASRDTLQVTGNALNAVFAGEHWGLVVHDGAGCVTMGDKTPGHLLAIMKAAVAQLEARGVVPDVEIELTYHRGLDGTDA